MSRIERIICDSCGKLINYGVAFIGQIKVINNEGRIEREGSSDHDYCIHCAHMFMEELIRATKEWEKLK